MGLGTVLLDQALADDSFVSLDSSNRGFSSNIRSLGELWEHLCQVFLLFRLRCLGGFDRSEICFISLQDPVLLIMAFVHSDSSFSHQRLADFGVTQGWPVVHNEADLLEVLVSCLVSLPQCVVFKMVGIALFLNLVLRISAFVSLLNTRFGSRSAFSAHFDYNLFN